MIPVLSLSIIGWQSRLTGDQGEVMGQAGGYNHDMTNAGGRKSLTNSLQLTQLSRHRPVRYAREDLQPKELKTLEDGRGAVSRVV